MDAAALIERQMAKQPHNQKNPDIAYEEVVASACETMLTDSNAVEKIALLEETEPGIIAKIKEFIKNILTKVRNLYKDIDPDSEEAKALREMKDTFKKFAELFEDMAVDAAKNKRAVREIESEGNINYSTRNPNAEVLSLIQKVKSKSFKANEKVYFDNVSDEIAIKIKNLTGIDVIGFKVVIEARQIEHILNDHGENGKTDHSMSDDNDIAKMEYILYNADEIVLSGRTQAYSYMKNGYNRTAETVKYEKYIGEKSYYVVQAVPDTKAKTLYVVSAFIGKPSIKKEASQLINAKSPDVTTEIGSVVTSNDSIPENSQNVNNVSENVSVK